MSRKILQALSAALSINDEQAMWRVQTQGDHRAFALLVERWEGPIFDLCARMLGDSHLGEDLKQTVFSRLFQKRADYRPSARFSTFLWRIALNLCYDELRRRQRRKECALPDSDEAFSESPAVWADAGSTPAERASQDEEGELVRQALLALPENYRAVLVLRHYQNLKLREIAEVLEIPEGTVNSRMAEALAQMTRLLEPRFGVVSKRTSRPGRGGISIPPSDPIQTLRTTD